MRDIRFDSEEESSVIIDIYETGGYVRKTLELRRVNPMHPVDDSHRVSLHQDGRELVLGLGQDFRMLSANASDPG
jgi:hypothetical protein